MVLLPWFQEDLRSKPTQLAVLKDCGKCMETTTQLSRQGRGCGFEPPAPAGVRVVPWQPPQRKLGYQHPRPTVCAGYLTRLPEVIEIARAHAHWSHGELATFCGTSPATDALVMGIEILDAEVSQLERYLLTPEADGGGHK